MNLFNFLKKKKDKNPATNFRSTVLASSDDVEMMMGDSSQESSVQNRPIMGNNLPLQGNVRGVLTRNYPENPSEDKNIDLKIKFPYGDIRPIQVFAELISEIPSMNLHDIDGQIKLIEQRKDLLKLLNTKQVNEDLIIKFLEARKKYNVEDFPWKVTTDTLIVTFLGKYNHLIKTSLKSYTPCVPNEALEEATKFLEAYKKIRPDEEPILEIICERKDAERKDPILLAYSPFGNWWYVLGAWDKEVEIVDDIIYHHK